MKLIYMKNDGKEWVEFTPKWNWKYEWVNTIYMSEDVIVTYLTPVCQLFPDHAPLDTVEGEWYSVDDEIDEEK